MMKCQGLVVIAGDLPRDRELTFGSDCETPKKSNFLKNGKMVISVKTRNFFRSQMTKHTSPLESPSVI